MKKFQFQCKTDTECCQRSAKLGQIIRRFVDATHCVIVVHDDVWFLNVFAAFCFHSGRRSVTNGAQKAYILLVSPS